MTGQTKTGITIKAIIVDALIFMLLFPAMMINDMVVVWLLSSDPT